LCLVHNASAQCNPVITPSGNTTFCDGDSVTLNASFGDTYQWYKDGNLINGAQGNTYVASTAGSYTVEIDSVGCVNMSPAVVITVNFPPPTPGPITGPAVVCQGTTQTYSVDPVSGAISYNWSGGWTFGWQNFFGTTSLPSRTAPVGESANLSAPDVSIMVTAENNCGSSSPSVLNIHSFAPVELGGMNNDPDITWGGISPYICPNGTSNILNGFHHGSPGGYNGPATYQWYRNNVLIPGATGYTYNVTKGGSYNVIITTGGVCSVNLQKPVVHQIAPKATSIDVLTPDPMCEGGVALLKVNWDMDGYDNNAFNWWWLRNDTIVQSPAWNSPYIVVSNPSAYKIGTGGSYTSIGSPWPVYLECPVSGILANVTLSNTQALPVYVIQNGMTLSASSGFVSYQWFRNTSPINGATNQDYTMTTWGDYFVLATDANGCVSQSNITLDVNNVQSGDVDLKVYPNPNTGLCNIKANLPGQNSTAELRLCDISGHTILTKEIPVKSVNLDETIDMSAYPAGLYFLKLSSGSFNKVISIVKQ
jgi:hypothetical protein